MSTTSTTTLARATDKSKRLGVPHSPSGASLKTTQGSSQEKTPTDRSTPTKKVAFDVPGQQQESSPPHTEPTSPVTELSATGKREYVKLPNPYATTRTTTEPKPAPFLSKPPTLRRPGVPFLPRPAWTITRLFEKQVSLRPDAPAIHAWDLDLSYAQLNACANRLAHYLVSHCRVKQGDLVPVCFEKSAWYFVSILAVNKAGAAWVPLDPGSPDARLHHLVRQTHAKIILSSSKNRGKITGFTQRHVVEVSDTLDGQLWKKYPSNEGPAVRVKASDAIYVLFTSGSTGTPKGLVMEHGAVAHSQLAISKRLRMTPDVRMLQFAAFVFDLSIGEIILPLISGACICVPSDEDRLYGLPAYIRNNNVTWAFLTPSFALTLDPAEVPALELLLLAGESPLRSILDAWVPLGRTRLVNGWGPAETCCFSTLHEWTSADESPTKIGKPVGCNCWIVDADDPTRLAPMGSDGEIMIQGPTILREYLADAKKTSQAVVDPLPSWAPDCGPAYRRFFKSGDLGRYNPDGTMEFLSRKDTQVKIRGLRVELGEVEHHVRSCLGENQQVAVEVFRGPSGSTLAGFFSPLSESKLDVVDNGEESPLRTIDADLRERLNETIRGLNAVIPGYMVPSIWIPMSWMPVITSTKINRKRLQGILNGLSDEEMSLYSLRAEKREPRTELESKLRALWADVLHRQADEGSIGVDDNFYNLGGDSIRVITLAKMVEQELGHNLIRTLISTQHTTIADQAKHIEGLRSGEDVGEGDVAGVDLMAEVETALEPLLGNCLDSLRQNPKSTLPPQATVFLTGATGYLGSELLRHLLRDAKYGRVVAHARAPSPEAGLERVVKAARINGWWRDSYADRIEIWTGDLGSHRLGLDDGQWDRLAGNSSGLNVDAIVHNGAVVNWNSSYDALYEANVKSATELLRLTMLSPRNPKFVFISGGVKFDTQEDKPGTASALANLMGYTQTKFVAETVINEVALRLPEGQNRISTIKPGRIIGTAEEGVANLDDFLWRIVGTAVAMGAYPTGPDEKWMFIEGVDIISSLVTSKLGTSSDGVTAFDDMKIGVSVERFWSLVNSQLPPGRPLRPMPLDEWIERAVHFASEVVGEKHPLYPVQNFLGAVGYPIEPEEGEKAWDSEMVRKLEGGIRASVKYIVECGYVDLCRGEDVELKGVIQRSTAVQV